MDINMINLYEVTETNKMIEKENLDVRTITLGISLLDCIDSDIQKLNDKIYNNIEFRGDVLNNTKDKLIKSTDILIPNICPFSSIKMWNEYQEGDAFLSQLYGKPSPLKQKFRIWRTNVPRDNANHRDRIRSPWAYLTLRQDAPNQGVTINRMQLHDVQVWYYDNDIWKYQQK